MLIIVKVDMHHFKNNLSENIYLEKKAAWSNVECLVSTQVLKLYDQLRRFI